jgi:hypothetical protein
MRQRRRGLSIVEVLVASSAFLVVMMIGVGALHVVKQAGDHLKGRSLPRQQLRVLLGHLQSDVRAATFVFDAHSTVSFAGASHSFAGAPPKDAAAAASQDCLWALAETADTEPSYKVEALFLQPDGPDRPFEGAQRMVWACVGGQRGATPGTPADIALGSLPADRTEVRTFATASPADGLRVRRTPSGDGLLFEFVIGHRTEAERVLYETYQAQLTMRNNR